MVEILLPVLLLIIIAILRFFETKWLYQNKPVGKKYAEWTLQAIGISYGLIIAGTLTEYFVLQRKLDLLITIIAFILMFLRILLKIWSVKTLNEFWSPYIEIKKEHKLVINGPYKYIRHPVYLGTILDSIAIPLFLNSYFTLWFISWIYIIIIFIRLNIEEKVLVKEFADEYLIYRKNTGMLLPKINIFKWRGKV